MSEKLQKLMEEIKGLTVMELSEFVKALEAEFGVSAAAPVAVVAAPAAAGEAEEAEEQTEFDIILKEVGPEKIKVIKTVREVTGLGLKEAKDVVDGAPSTVKEGVDKAAATEITEKFKAVGATVEVK